MSEQDRPDDLFPVRFVRKDDPMPEEPIAFMVGRNGAFVKRETAAFMAVVPADELPMLAMIEQMAEYRLPPLPAERVMQMLLFFRAVWVREHSEAILIISYNASRGTFRLEAPEQRVASGHIDYDMPKPTEGFVFIGTVHSHGSMSAFHSSTDTSDEAKFDGIHITFGRVNERLVDIVATLAVNARRFPQSVERVLAGVTLVDNHGTGEYGPHVPSEVESVTALEKPQDKKSRKRRTRAKQPRWMLPENHSPLPTYDDRRNRFYYQAPLPSETRFSSAYEKGYLVEVPPDVPLEEYRPLLNWSAAVHKYEYPSFSENKNWPIGFRPTSSFNPSGTLAETSEHSDGEEPAILDGQDGEPVRTRDWIEIDEEER